MSSPQALLAIYAWRRYAVADHASVRHPLIDTGNLLINQRLHAHFVRDVLRPPGPVEQGRQLPGQQKKRPEKRNRQRLHPVDIVLDGIGLSAVKCPAESQDETQQAVEDETRNDPYSKHVFSKYLKERIKVFIDYSTKCQ